jgi:hypothetical protein
MRVNLHICNKLLFLEINFTTGFNATDRPSCWQGRGGSCARSKEVVFWLVCSPYDKTRAAFVEMRTYFWRKYFLESFTKYVKHYKHVSSTLLMSISCIKPYYLVIILSKVTHCMNTFSHFFYSFSLLFFGLSISLLAPIDGSSSTY